AILGDVNPELMNAYEMLRGHPWQLWRRATAFSQKASVYYVLRRVDPEGLSPLDRAARFIYLNRYCFNGVYRTNRRGQFNVPRGHSTGGIPPPQSFYRCSVALRAAALIRADFSTTLADAKAHDFVYLDPP